MTEMLTVRRLPQMQADLNKCRKLYRRLFPASPPCPESDVVRLAIQFYAADLEARCIKEGKLKR